MLNLSAEYLKYKIYELTIHHKNKYNNIKTNLRKTEGMKWQI